MSSCERKALLRLLRKHARGHHPATLSCTYDDFGTGASGMAPKPCAKYRAEHVDSKFGWCAECQLRRDLEQLGLLEEYLEGNDE